jgi:hypothetical protein
MLGALAFGPPVILVDGDKGVPATEEDFECRHCFRNQTGSWPEVTAASLVVLYRCIQPQFI